jgi:hypothetical protein
LDTGSVVSTYRVSAASWAALALVLAHQGPAWVGFVYAAAFVLPLIVLTTMTAYSRSLRRRLVDAPAAPRLRSLRTLAMVAMLASVAGYASQWAF